MRRQYLSITDILNQETTIYLRRNGHYQVFSYRILLNQVILTYTNYQPIKTHALRSYLFYCSKKIFYSLRQEKPMWPKRSSIALHTQELGWQILEKMPRQRAICSTCLFKSVPKCWESKAFSYALYLCWKTANIVARCRD